MLAEVITTIVHEIIFEVGKKGSEIVLKEFDIHIGEALTNKLANEYGNYRAENPTDTITFEDFRDKIKTEAKQQLKNVQSDDPHFVAWYSYFTQNIAEQ
jgi:hypothetical protein